MIVPLAVTHLVFAVGVIWQLKLISDRIRRMRQDQTNMAYTIAKLQQLVDGTPRRTLPPVEIRSGTTKETNQ